MLVSEPYGIHWFRRDLRAWGHPSLEGNRERYRGRTLGLFCVDPGILARPDFSVSRFAFILNSLQSLREALRERGGDLLVVEGSAPEAFSRLFEELRKKKLPLPAKVTHGRDYEPYALKRDEAIRAMLEGTYGVPCTVSPDHLLIQPEELYKPTGGPGSFYQVYTPFKKRWLAIARSSTVRDRVKALSAPPAKGKSFTLTWKSLMGKPPVDLLDAMVAEHKPTVKLPEAGERAALESIREFGRERIEDYASARDVPSINGTSRVSAHLKCGALTVGGIIGELALFSANAASARKYFEELIWREFYVHVLFHRHDVEDGPFLKQYSKIRWENDPRLFAAWKEGRTGFPMVDAGMRQLAQTGFMHNRLRMITASFLVKDLHIDWRWGERHFMNHLIDGDLASNNGGWQWAASTGCDPQPYFRVFNPELQAKRYDPKREFISRWVPEVGTKSYPAPIVEHSQRARKIVSLFREARQGDKLR